MHSIPGVTVIEDRMRNVTLVTMQGITVEIDDYDRALIRSGNGLEIVGLKFEEARRQVKEDSDF